MASGNAQRIEAERRYRCVTRFIADGAIAAIVRLSVDLDRTTRRQTGEVEAVSVERVLAAEDQAVRAGAECLPEADFGGVAGAAFSAG